jgi:hypothetical protein
MNSNTTTRILKMAALVCVLALIACEGKPSGSSSSSGGGGSGPKELAQQSGALNAVVNKARPASEFSYDLTADGQGILIKGFTGAAGDVVVPEKIEDISVMEIGQFVFSGKAAGKNAGITAIILPNTVKKIGHRAFTGTAITQFIMSDNVTEIGQHLFYNCKALTEVHLSDSIDTIEGALFDGCKSLKKVNLPKSLKYLGIAFENCGELSELVIPPEITQVTFVGWRSR